MQPAFSEAAHSPSAHTIPVAPAKRSVGPSTGLDGARNGGSLASDFCQHCARHTERKSAMDASPALMSHQGGYVMNVTAMLTGLQLHKLWCETNNFVERLTKDVREVKNVNAASDFVRWLQWTGLLEILVAAESPMPLPVRGGELKLKVKKLLDACNDLYQDGKATPRYTESDIAEINRKLDIIAAHVATTLPINNENNNNAGFTQVADESSQAGKSSPDCTPQTS